MLSLFRKIGRPVSRQFAVLGLGRFGSSVAQTLVELGHEVLGVDARDDLVQSLSAVLTHCVQADVTDEQALASLGLRNFDVVVVSIGALEPSILATLTAKELGVPYVVAKATSHVHGKLLQRVGADRVVFPERDMGVRVARHLVHGHLIDYLELAPGYRIVEVKANGPLVGHTLAELDLRARFGINILVIKRGEQIIMSPGAQDVIQEGDVLVAIAPDEALAQFEASSPS